MLQDSRSRDTELNRDLCGRPSGFVSLPNLLYINLPDPPVPALHSLMIYSSPNRTAMAAERDGQDTHALASRITSCDFSPLTAGEVLLPLIHARSRLNTRRALTPRPLKQAHQGWTFVPERFR
jgi:hypothetical protein